MIKKVLGVISVLLLSSIIVSARISGIIGGAIDGTAPPPPLISSDACGDTSGITWTERSNPKNVLLRSVVWNQDDGGSTNFVAVGATDGVDHYIVTSSDGASWTERSGISTNLLESVTYSPSLNRYVAVGTDTRMNSDDGGVTWTFRSLDNGFGSELSHTDVVWSPELNLFVAPSSSICAFLPTRQCFGRSADGITWSKSLYSFTSESFSGVAWSATLNLFAAVGGVNTGNAVIATSPDGISWTQRTSPKNVELMDIVWDANNNQFVTVGGPDGTDAYILTSSDGITWTERSNPLNIQLEDVTASNNQLVAVGLTGGTGQAYVITSSDGVTWTQQSNPKPVVLYSVVCSNSNGLVAVGEADGTDAYIITSP